MSTQGGNGNGGNGGGQQPPAKPVIKPKDTGDDSDVSNLDLNGGKGGRKAK